MTKADPIVTSPLEDSALRRAKRPRTVLAGPYGHPFHALLVTIPIGAWTASFVFDLIAVFGKDPDPFARGAAWLIVIGLVGGVLAVVTGLHDFSLLTRGTKARATALAHMILNLTVMVILSIGVFARFTDDDGGASGGGIALSVVALLMLAVSGFLGGELAYRFGVRVADESTQRAAHTQQVD